MVFKGHSERLDNVDMSVFILNLMYWVAICYKINVIFKNDGERDEIMQLSKEINVLNTLYGNDSLTKDREIKIRQFYKLTQS